jgi:hypothetical protein
LDLRPLSEENKHFGIVEPRGQGVCVLDVIVPNFDFVTGKLLEALQRSERVMVVVQDGYFHVLSSR